MSEFKSSLARARAGDRLSPAEVIALADCDDVAVMM